MLNMTRDEHFPMSGALDVFEVIPGPKRMGVWAGTHELPPESMQLITDFFGRVLGWPVEAISTRSYDPRCVVAGLHFTPYGGVPPVGRCAARCALSERSRRSHR